MTLLHDRLLLLLLLLRLLSQTEFVRVSKSRMQIVIKIFLIISLIVQLFFTFRILACGSSSVSKVAGQILNELKSNSFHTVFTYQELLF